MDRNEFLKNCFAKTLDECSILRTYHLDGYSERQICLVDNQSSFVVYGELYNQKGERKEKHFDNIIDAYHYAIDLICLDDSNCRTQRRNYLTKTFWHYIYMDALEIVCKGPNGKLPYDIRIGSCGDMCLCLNQTVYGYYIVYYYERGNKDDIKTFPPSKLKEACEHLIRLYADDKEEADDVLAQFSYLTSRT